MSKIILKALFLLIIVQALFFVATETYPDKLQSVAVAAVKYAKNRVQKGGKEVQILAFGDSSAYFNIDPSQFNGDIETLGAPAASFFELYYMLQRFIENNGAPKTILFSAMVNFYPYYDVAIRDHFIKGRFYSLPMFVELMQAMPAERQDSFFYYSRFVLDSIGFFGTNLENLHRYMFSQEKAFGENFYHRMEKNRGYFPVDGQSSGVIANFQSQWGESYEADSLVSVYIEKLANLVARNQIQLVILRAPVHSNVYQFSRGYFDSYWNFINDAFGGVKSVYFYHQEVEDSDFSDGFHLNRNGGRKYSKAIRRFLEGKNLLDRK